jgi:hypothetical protein
MMMNLINSGRIDINETFDNGSSTILSYITNIDHLRTLLQKVYPTKLDLRHMMLHMKFDDFSKIAKEYIKPEDFTDIVINSNNAYIITNTNLIEQMLEHEKIIIPKFINYLLSHVINYPIKKLLDNPKYPEWTVKDNPLIHSILNEQFLSILEYEKTLPFLKSLTSKELEEIFSVITNKKVYNMSIDKGIKSYFLENFRENTEFLKKNYHFFRLLLK